MLMLLTILFLLFEFENVSAETGDPAVNVFARKCAKLIKSNPITLDLLRVANFPANVAAKSLHDALLTQYLVDGFEKAKQIADFNQETTEIKFTDITPSKFGDVICVGNGNILKKRGLLTEEDAHQLAKLFVQDGADAADYYDTTTAKGKWQSIIRGFGYFYARLGLSLDELAKDLSNGFSNTLSCVKNNTCR